MESETNGIEAQYTIIVINRNDNLEATRKFLPYNINEMKNAIADSNAPMAVHSISPEAVVDHAKRGALDQVVLHMGIEDFYPRENETDIDFLFE